MTNFETAVKIISDDYQNDMKSLDAENIGEVWECYWMDNKDLKEEFLFILTEATNDGKINFFFTDNCEIEDSDGKFRTFSELKRAVKKVRRIA